MVMAHQLETWNSSTRLNEATLQLRTKENAHRNNGVAPYRRLARGDKDSGPGSIAADKKLAPYTMTTTRRQLEHRLFSASDLFLFLILSATVILSNGKEADFLYSILPFEESDPVLEFEPPPTNTSHNEKGEDLALRPDFLYSTEQRHRVVLYYLPWCPHCKHYVPTYISLARRVQEMIQEKEEEDTYLVEFYAVSCLPNKQLCKDQQVSGVPGIKIFRGGTTDGIPADPLRLHPFQILRILGIPWGSEIDLDLDDLENKNIVGGNLRQQKRRIIGNGKNNNNNNNNNNRKKDLFGDAYRSFHFSLKTEIFMTNGPLEEKPKKAFADWLLLLQNALPITWKIQPLLQELVDNFETISKDENELIKVLDKHPPSTQMTEGEWSYSCSHGEEGNGFTCGLWQLFHLVTVGVVQYNSNAISTNEKSLYKTADVAQTLRNYIEHFFACNVCREEFLTAFDSCSNDHCNRLLVDTIGEQRDWMELPLWLFEEHNSVNVRLKQERSREPITKEDIEGAQWPARRDCPKCWADDEINKVAVYNYLVEQYWPGYSFSHSEANSRGLLGSLFESSSDESILAIPSAILLLPLIGPVILLGTWLRTRQKKRSGLHKKIDL